jgi:hypothetical protein
MTLNGHVAFRAAAFVLVVMVQSVAFSCKRWLVERLSMISTSIRSSNVRICKIVGNNEVLWLARHFGAKRSPFPERPHTRIRRSVGL